MNSKTKIIIITLLVLIAGTIYIEYPKQVTQPVACTADARICPDGSYVGRAGPKCEFSACPITASTTSANIGQKITIGSVTISPLKLIEDSRCPAGVACIQEGTVSLKANLEIEGKTQTETMKLGVPIVFGGKQVSLREVDPAKSSVKEIDPADYLFNFSVVDSPVSTSGTLKGSVTIGPICPVNMVGYPCKPTAEIYAAAKVFVYMADKKTLVTTLIPDARGEFSVQLPSGTYFIDMIHQRIGGTKGVPVTVNVAPLGTVVLSLHVDTGLR